MGDQLVATVSVGIPPVNGTVAAMVLTPLTGSLSITNFQVDSSYITEVDGTALLPGDTHLTFSAFVQVFIPAGGLELTLGPFHFDILGAGTDLSRVDVTNPCPGPTDLCRCGLCLSTGSPITLDSYADTRPGTPWGSLLPQLARLLDDISAPDVATSIDQLLIRLLTFPSSSPPTPDVGAFIEQLFVRLLTLSSNPLSTSVFASPNNQVGGVIHLPAGGGGGPSSPPADSDDDLESLYKRKETVEEPYSEEPGAEADDDAEADPDLDEPVEGDQPPSRLGRQAHEVDELDSRLLPPINLDLSERRLDRVPSGLNDTPSRASAPCVEREGIHQDPTPGSVGEKLVYASVWVGLTWPAPHQFLKKQRQVGYTPSDDTGKRPSTSD